MTCGRKASRGDEDPHQAATPRGGLRREVHRARLAADRLPPKDFEAAVGVLAHGGAGFDEIAGVHIGDAADVADDGMMDVAADNAVGALTPGLVGQGLLEGADEIDRVLHLQLGPGGQRPVGETERPADPVEPGVGEQGEFVGPVAEQGEPAGIGDDDVELIPVDDEKAAAVRRFVDHAVHQFDPAEAQAEIAARELVVVAGQEDDPRALADLAQQLLDHVVMGLGPIPPTSEAPAVDDVADEVDRIGIVVFQEIDQEFRLAAALSQMNVGNEQRAVSGAFWIVAHAGPARVRWSLPVLEQSRATLP